MEMNFDRVTVPSTQIYRRKTTYTGQIPMSRTAPSRTIGAATLRSSAGRSVVSPIATRTNVIPPSTLVSRGGGVATQGVYGGISEGMGIGPLPTALGPATLTNFGSSVSKASTGIINTLGSFVPLAIKVVLAVIVIKIVLWLIRGRRR